MAEAGSFADRVKQQADIVRVVGEYVRLKKSGQNFTGLCPFHSEKTPSFAVHPVKQIYHCFGCGAGGDVFKFVMEMDKITFPESVRAVAEKSGIAIPRAKERTPEERQQNQQRTSLVELHREAAVFFVQQLNGTQEGRAAKAYLLDRGLDPEAMARFGIGFAPSGGEALLRAFQDPQGDPGVVGSLDERQLLRVAQYPGFHCLRNRVLVAALRPLIDANRRHFRFSHGVVVRDSRRHHCSNQTSVKSCPMK